jgi:hypothetical protein
MVTSYGTTFKSGALRNLPWIALPNATDTSPTKVDDKIKWHALSWIDADYATAIPVTIAPGNDYGSPNLAARQADVTAANGTGWGLIATGDTSISDVSPSFSHDGKSIVYVTTDYSPDGHPDATATLADIRTVPYNDRKGGTSIALPGASDPSLLEYYPSYSGDDKLIAFTQAPKPGAASPDGPYYNRMGQVMIIPAAGGTATPSLRMSWRASSRRPRSKSLRWIRRWRTPAASCAPCPAVQTSLTLRGCLQRTSTAKPPSPVT